MYRCTYHHVRIFNTSSHFHLNNQVIDQIVIVSISRLNRYLRNFRHTTIGKREPLFIGAVLFRTAWAEEGVQPAWFSVHDILLFKGAERL
jgi:hypothetical protein